MSVGKSLGMDVQDQYHRETLATRLRQVVTCRAAGIEMPAGWNGTGGAGHCIFVTQCVNVAVVRARNNNNFRRFAACQPVLRGDPKT